MVHLEVRFAPISLKKAELLASGFHPRLPLTAEAMARDGALCVAAGAAELHLDPRGPSGQESLAAVDTTILAVRRTCPGTLIGAYGSAEMLGWLVHERGIEPHIPVFDNSQRLDGTFERATSPTITRPTLYLPYREGTQAAPKDLSDAAPARR